MTRHSGNFSFAPNSVDAVLRTDDGLVFSCRGAQSEIAISLPEEGSEVELLLTGSSGATSVLFKGAIGEASARFEEIHLELLSNANPEKPTPFYTTKPFFAASAVAAILIAVGFFSPQTTNLLRSLEMKPHTLSSLDQDPVLRMTNPMAPTFLDPSQSTGGAVISDVVSAPDIFDIPGRAMPDPGETTLFPGPVAAFEPSDDDFNGSDEPMSVAVIEEPRPEEPMETVGAADERAKPASLGILGDIKAMSSAAQAPAPTEETPGQAQATGLVDQPLPTNTDVSEEQITRQITTAISSGSMSAENAQSFLDALSDLKSDNPQVTKAMLRELPEEVTSMLAQTGLLDELLASGEGETEYRIIRLPEEIIELYRGADGIASIPERFSWAATGNYVSLPLPGGGDVKRADHMKEFGLSLQ